MAPDLPPFSDNKLVTQLESWTKAVFEPNGEKFIIFEDFEETFGKETPNQDRADIYFDFIEILQAVTSFEALHQKTRLYTEAFAALETSIKAETTPKSLMLESQAAVVEKWITAVNGLRDKLQVLGVASKDLSGRVALLQAAYNRIESCISDAPLTRLAEEVEKVNQAMSDVSSNTLVAIGKVPRPNTNDERAKVVSARWGDVVAVEQAGEAKYQEYRLLENTISCLRVLRPNLRIFLDYVQSLDTPPLDEAAALLSDLQGVLTCGDAVEAKVLLAQDFAAVNQAIVKRLVDIRLQRDGFVGSDWIRATKSSTEAKSQWQHPGFSGPTVYGISHFRCGGTSGGSISVTVDPKTSTLKLEMSGSKVYGEVNYIHLPAQTDNIRTGNIVIKPSSSPQTEVISVAFDAPMLPKGAICWLTKFSLASSASQKIDKEIPWPRCDVTSTSKDGLRIAVTRPATSDVAVGWLAWSETAKVASAQAASKAPNSWCKTDTWEALGTEVWANKKAVKFDLDLSQEVDAVPQIAVMINNVQTLDEVKTAVQRCTRTGAVVHSEASGLRGCKVVAAIPSAKAFDMIFIP